jgi:uncharacterized protein YndB with AHSA1/START domain
MPESTSRSIAIARIVEAPADLVFAAWTDAAHLTRWWGPEGFTVPAAESDARPGGAFAITMRGPDGTDHRMTGIYREFDPPRRLVAASQVIGADGRQLLEAVTTVTLTEHDGKTELTVEETADALVPEAVAMLGGMEIGMSQSLRRLDDLVTGAIDRQIVLTRFLEAPRERVFEVWTSPEHLAAWWGPNGFSLTTHEIDVRPGGSWRFTMHGPDGVDHPNRLTYEEIVRPELLVYRHDGLPEDEDPSFRGTVTFDDFGGLTILTMRNVFQTTAARDETVEKYDAVDGGNQTLDRLVAYVVKARHDV